MDPVYIALIAVFVSLIAVFVARKRPAQSNSAGSSATSGSSAEPSRSASASAHHLLTDVLTLRTQWLCKGASQDALASLDRMIGRLFQSAPALDAVGSASIDAARPIILNAEPNGDDLARRESTLEELLILSSGGMTGGSSTDFAGLQAWWERLQGLPSLNRVSSDLSQWIATVLPGDFVEVRGDLGLVTNVHRYEETYQGESWTWHEIVFRKLRDDELSSFEWEHDDDIEMWRSVTEVNPVELGLDRDRMVRMVHEDDGSVRWGNQTYELEDNGEAQFFKEGQAPSTRFVYLEFENGSDKSIGVEDWGSDIRAYVVEKMKRDGVKLYRA